MESGIWHAVGFVSYRGGLAVQDHIAEERELDLCPDTLLLLEHPPTVTLGRRAGDMDLLWSAERLAREGISLERVSRGGGATFHGPGQLVGYPIVRVAHHGRGVRRFVTALEEVLIDVARRFGVRATVRDGHPGIWVGERKLASIGIQVRRGVSRHGFALNVKMDLAPFRAIVPCGMPGLEMTDLSREARIEVSITAASAAVVRAWQARFGEIATKDTDGGYVA